jgi:hypothetical protein
MQRYSVYLLFWYKSTNTDAESRQARRNAVLALVELVEAVGIGGPTPAGGGGGHALGGGRRLEQAHMQAVLEACCTCLKDYSMDNRGDVGSWVREAAMFALERLVPLVVARDAQRGSGLHELAWLSDALVKRILDALVQQVLSLLALLVQEYKY